MAPRKSVTKLTKIYNHILSHTKTLGFRYNQYISHIKGMEMDSGAPDNWSHVYLVVVYMVVVHSVVVYSIVVHSVVVYQEKGVVHLMFKNKGRLLKTSKE